MQKFWTCCLCVFILCICMSRCYRPLVIWHGFNDSCEGPIQNIISHIRSTLPGIYVFCVRIGNSSSSEKRASVFMPLKQQLDIACEQLAGIPELREGFNAFGESQGGILMRAVVQKCPPGPVHNLVTLSSPHQGVYGIPECTETIPKYLCNMMVSLFNLDVYSRFVQGLLTAAEYWHDPLKETEYREASAFLAEFNNERNFNQDFKRNLIKINKFIMIRNTDDKFVVPNYTSHFGFFSPGSVTDLVNFTSTRVFEEDLLGLKEMFSNNQLVFENIPGEHCRLNWTWFEGFTRKFLQ